MPHNALFSDATRALRWLCASPVFVLTTVMTLGLGIGVSTALFAAINGVLLKPLAIDRPDRLVIIGSTERHEIFAESGLRREWLRRFEGRPSETLAGIGSFAFFQGSARAGDRQGMVKGEAVGGDYFGTLGIAPEMGRLLGRRDDDASTPEGAVISHRLWTSWFASDPSVVGRTMDVGGRTLTVVGVVPERFQGLHGGRVLGNDIWVPQRSANLPLNTTVLTFARLRPHATLAMAMAEMAALPTLGEFGLPERSLTVVPFAQVLDSTPPALVALGGVVLLVAGLVLLLVCGNLLGLLASRIASRTAEFAVRLTLGASHGRLVQLIAVELFLLLAAAGILGALLGAAAGSALDASPLSVAAGLSVHIDARPDWRVFCYALLVTMVTGMGLTWALSRRMFGMHALSVLSATAGVAHVTGRTLYTSKIVAIQMACSATLLVAAGVAVRSATAALTLDPGLHIEHVAVGWIDHRLEGRDQFGATLANDEVIRRLEGTPGVTAAALASQLPGTEGSDWNQVEADNGKGVSVHIRAVSAKFFLATGLRLSAGHDFSDTGAGVEPIAVVSQSVGDALWPNQDPLGRWLTVPDGQGRRSLVRVVGVAPDVRVRSSSNQQRIVFVPLSQRPSTRVAVVITGPGSGPANAATMRLALAQGAAAEVYGVGSLADYYRLSTGPLRGAALLLTLLGCIGGGIALMGVYGVVSSAAAARRRDFSVMKALGARPSHIYRATGVDSLKALTVGVVPGVCVGGLLSLILQAYIPQVNAYDWAPFVLVPAGLLGSGLIATLLPLHRTLKASTYGSLKEL